jgi:Spy/CpxP family protein refolding chaperone
MPGRNGMGPMGQGPMMKGGRDWCGGAASQMEIPQRGPGFAIRRGHGRGGGWRHRHWFHATSLTGWQRAQLDWPVMGAVSPKEHE